MAFPKDSTREALVAACSSFIQRGDEAQNGRGGLEHQLTMVYGTYNSNNDGLWYL